MPTSDFISGSTRMKPSRRIDSENVRRDSRSVKSVFLVFLCIDIFIWHHVTGNLKDRSNFKASSVPR